MSLESILALLGLTMTDAVVTAGSAVVVAALVAAIYLAGFRRTTRIDEQALAELADAEGARVTGAVIHPGGQAALAQLADGKILAARVMGDAVGARIAAAETATVELRRSRLRVAFGDLGFPALSWRLQAEAPGWLRELARE